MHQGKIDWKVRTRELCFEHLAKAVAPQIFGLEAVKMKIILRQIEWTEKRNALNVIPMIVRDENVRLQWAVAFGIRPMIAKHA